jgi:hypothetical protein
VPDGRVRPRRPRLHPRRDRPEARQLRRGRNPVVIDLAGRLGPTSPGRSRHEPRT